MSPRDERIWRHAAAALQGRHWLGRQVYRIRDGEDYDADGFDRFVAEAEHEYDRQCDRVRGWREARDRARSGVVDPRPEPVAVSVHGLSRR